MKIEKNKHKIKKFKQKRKFKLVRNHN